MAHPQLRNTGLHLSSVSVNLNMWIIKTLHQYYEYIICIIPFLVLFNLVVVEYETYEQIFPPLKKKMFQNTLFI